MLDLDKVLCGDCRVLFKELPDKCIDLIVTSPPYNVGIDYSDWDDRLSWDDYKVFMKEWLSESYRVLKDDGRIALNVLFECNMHERGGGF